MEQWELSDEETKEIFAGKVIFASSPEMRREAEANLVAKAAQKKLVEWGRETCYEHPKNISDSGRPYRDNHFNCTFCQESLCKKLGVKDGS